MELINTVASSVKAKMDRASFTMNTIINDPTATNALELFQEALLEFSLAKTQMQTIGQIAEQIQKHGENNEVETNPNDSGDRQGFSGTQ
jgi:hypothetical protein